MSGCVSMGAAPFPGAYGAKAYSAADGGAKGA